jgi:hypothetical protein
MTHAEWVAVLLAVLQGGVPALLIGIVGRMLHLGQRDLKAAQIELHLSMNSRLDQSLKAERALGDAEGMARGLEQGRLEKS